MELDLRREFTDIYAYVVERVRTFDPATNDGPGDGGPITGIDIGFGLFGEGWVALVFDTRPEGAPDGEWNEHIEGNCLERPQWAAADDANVTEPLA